MSKLTVEDVLQFCGSLERAWQNEAGRMRDEGERRFCKGKVSAYRHIKEHIQTSQAIREDVADENWVDSERARRSEIRDTPERRVGR